MNKKNQNIILNLVLVAVMIALVFLFFNQRKSKTVNAKNVIDQKTIAVDKLVQDNSLNPEKIDKNKKDKDKDNLFSSNSEIDKVFITSPDKIDLNQMKSVFAEGTVTSAIKVQINYDLIEELFKTGSKFNIPTADGEDVLIKPTKVRENIQNSFEYFGVPETGSSDSSLESQLYLVFKEKKLLGGYLVFNGTRNEFVSTVDDLYIVKPNSIELH